MIIAEIISQLDHDIYGISIKRFLIFFGIILSTFIIRLFFLYTIDKKITLLKIAKSEAISMTISAIRDPLGYMILVHGLYVSIISLQLPKNVGPFEVESMVRNIYVLTVSFIVLYFSFRIIDIIGLYIDKKAKDTESAIDEQIAPLIVKSIRILVVTIGILSILSNFGYNITSLVAGLGIGGLAFALAAQTTVSNLFGSVTIFSDKPFSIGDTIQIATVKGKVEEVVFRTTRIRRSDQALVTVPNSKFVNTEIVNYSAMTKQKIEFYLKIEKDTHTNKIRDLISEINNIIKENEKFDHSSSIVRFSDFGDQSLNIYVCSLVNTIDSKEFHTIKEDLNFKIMQLFEELGIRMSSSQAT